ncbi:integrase catalytic domain-containing protein [Trichonephila clavipes]|nr:integrase catalytic domain-containing protein [Trichonephila clavipes]
MKKVKEALNLHITAVQFWSDSTIVISWIHRESRELKTFVANRVSKIHRLSSCDQWHHIASEQNPADVLSRGLLPEELRDDSLWWHGLELLLQSAYSTTVIAEPTQRDDFDCELRVSERTLETSLLNSKNFDFFNHLMDLSNNYFKIIHIVSYIYRFIENCRSKVKKRGPLTTSEDDKGVLRVGGRLEKASIPYSQKNPAILAKNSKLSKIYFITLHKKLFHVGPQGLLNAVRLRFWALGGRNLARKTVHTCVVCFKCKPIPYSQIMGNLPYERIKPLAENNKGNSGSLEKMEYRLSEYSSTERKVDDREGQYNLWYNGNCKGGDFIPVCNWLLVLVVEIYHGSDATRGLSATDLVILNHDEVTRTTPEMASTSPTYHITPIEGSLFDIPVWITRRRTVSFSADDDETVANVITGPHQDRFECPFKGIEWETKMLSFIKTTDLSLHKLNSLCSGLTDPPPVDPISQKGLPLVPVSLRSFSTPSNHHPVIVFLNKYQRFSLRFFF